MVRVVKARYNQGFRTADYPRVTPAFPPRYRGAPLVDGTACADDCSACVEACPTGAISRSSAGISLDLGRCLFCTACADACPPGAGAIEWSGDHRMAVSDRSSLVIDSPEVELARSLDKKLRRTLGRSLKLRQVSAGGCGACEADVNVLGTVVYDLGRFGIQFVASPRHADGLLITGCVTASMKEPLLAAYEAIPDPKIVIAVGACAISGGPYIGHRQANDGAAGLVPVDLFVPGCPPHPWTILDGMLRLLGRIE